MATDEPGRTTPDLFTVLSKPEDEWAAGLTALAKDWEQRLLPLHPKWIEHAKFVEGQQWGYFDRKSWKWVAQSFARPQVRETRVTLNFVQGIVSQLRAVLTRETPNWGVYAATSDSIDVASSMYGDALVKWIWRQHRLDEKYGDTVEFAATFGTYYVEVMWDENKGREREGALEDILPPEFEETTDEFGDPSWEMTRDPEPVFAMEREGGLCFALRSPFEVINAPGSSADHPGEAIFTVTDLRLADVQAIYGEKAEGVVPDAGPDESGASDVARLRAMMRDTLSSASDQEYDESVRVYKCYVAECLRYPLGKEIHFTESKVLHSGDNPAVLLENEEGEPARYPWPLFTLRHFKRARAWHGKSAVQDLVGPQVSCNGAASKELKIAKDHAHPRLRVPVGSKVDLNNASDSVIEYSPRHGPDEVSYLKPGDLPPALKDISERYRNYMEIIAGTHGMERTYAEDSGRKLQLMQQVSLGKLQPVKDCHDETWTDIIHHAMTLWKRHASHERKVIVVGENHAVNMMVFDQNSISGTHDVILHRDTALPTNPEARNLAITNIIQNTQNLPPDLRGQVWELYGVKDFLKIEQSMWTDRNRAREENILMLQGQPVSVEFWEDDDQHLAEHIVEMNTTSWRARVRAEGGPQVSNTYQTFVQHVQQHNLNKQAKQSGGAVTGQGMPNQAVVPPMGAPSPQGAPVPQGMPQGGPPNPAGM